jgi:hypothetical protein
MNKSGKVQRKAIRERIISKAISNLNEVVTGDQLNGLTLVQRARVVASVITI